MKTKNNGLRRFCLSMTFIGGLLGLVGRCDASQTITIFDNAEGPITAFVNGVPVVALADSTDDYIHFTYLIENNVVNTFPTGTSSRDLLEPGSLKISDRLVITSILGENFFDVKFDSRDTILLAIGDVSDVPIVEDGTLQLMGSYTIAGAAGGAIATGAFYAQSDVERIPEPSTSALMMVAFLALTGIRLRRR